MSSSASSDSAQATSAASSSGDQNLSNVLGSISQSSTNTASATQSSASSASSASASSGSSGSSGSSSASPTSATASSTVRSAQTTASSASSSSISITSGAVVTLTDLPTLSGGYSYPAPTVPPMANAPYLQKANVPENFVFIIVGAAIAFVALIIIAWRVFTSWSINRRFQRHDGGFAAHHRSTAYTSLADSKQKQHIGSSHDMKDLGKLPRNFSNVPSLFFSPTAEVARHSMRQPSSRAESHQHLPAGHYRDASDSAR